MEILLNVLKLLPSLAIVLLCADLQRRAFRYGLRTEQCFRTTFGIPLVCLCAGSALGLLAASGYVVVVSISPDEELSIGTAWRVFAVFAGTALVVAVKSIVAIIILGLNVAWTAFAFMFDEEPLFFPMWEKLLDLTVGWTPEPIQWLYGLGSLGTALFSALRKNFDQPMNAVCS